MGMEQEQALDPLGTIARWTAIEDDERRAVLAGLATALGDGWRAGRTRVGRRGLGELVYAGLPTGELGFVVVPGGWFRMGLSVDDVLAAARACEDDAIGARWGNTIIAARPTRWVRVRPFLLAIAGLPPVEGGAATDGGHASAAYRDAVAATRGEPASDAPVVEDEEPPMRSFTPEELEAPDVIPAGFRWPSEAELEYAFREGGDTRWIGVAPGEVVTVENRGDLLLGTLANGFGLLGFRDTCNPAADREGPYDASSPIDQRARNAAADGARVARSAHTYWQDEDAELLAVLAGHRTTPDEYGTTIVRLAKDLPLADEDALGEPPGSLADHAATLAALHGDDPRELENALVALGHVTWGRGDDLADTATAVIGALAELPPAARAGALRWLAAVQITGLRFAVHLAPERKRRDDLPADRAAVRAAVIAGVDAIVAQLDHADPDVRSAAALALTFNPDTPLAAQGALAQRLAREAVDGVRVAIRIALTRLGAPVAGGSGELDTVALAIGMAHDGALPPPMLDALIAATGMPPVPHLAFADGDLGNVAYTLVAAHGDDDARTRAAARLATRAVAEGDGELARAALEMMFGELPRHEPHWPRAIDSLTVDQRAVIEQLVDLELREVPWRAAGLPPTASARRRALGLAPRGPADHAVPYRGDTESLAFALAHLAARAGSADAAERATAEAERAAVIAALAPAARLAAALDLPTYHLGHLADAVRGDALDALDAAAVRDAIATFLAHPARARGGVAVIAAAARARPALADGEVEPAPLDPALLAELDDAELAHARAHLVAFRGSAVADRLRGAARAYVERALASERWSLGAHDVAVGWAALLAHAPSPSVARLLLALGWAGGQPAMVRDAVGTHAAAPAIATVLAEYDALPAFTTWPAARAGLAAFLAPALAV